MSDDYENIRRLQNQRFIVSPNGRPSLDFDHRWIVTYAVAEGGDYRQCVMTFPTRESCMSFMLEGLHFGEEIVWFHLIEATQPIQTFVNADHTDKEVRREMRDLYHYDENPDMISLTEEIDEYIEDDIVDKAWMDQGMRMGPNGEMIYEL